MYKAHNAKSLISGVCMKRQILPKYEVFNMFKMFKSTDFQIYLIVKFENFDAFTIISFTKGVDHSMNIFALRFVSLNLKF